MFAEDSPSINEEFPTFSDALESDAYISQFLNIQSFSIESLSVKSDENLNDLMQNARDQIAENRVPKKKKKSIYHNFQKHLVNTFRKFIEEEHFPVYEN